VSAVAFDTQFAPTTDYELTAKIVPADQDGSQAPALQTIAMDANKSQQKYAGTLAAQLPAPPDVNKPFSTLQTVQLQVSAQSRGREVAKTSIDIQLLNTSRELMRPAANPTNMQQLAELTGGEMIRTERELARLLEQFPSTPGEVLVQRSPVWDRSYFWAALLLLLGVEWSMRRRSGFG
jgi:hypothetical protein